MQPQLYKLYKSTNPSKKFDVYVIDPKTQNVRKVSFGATGYEDYTIHKDKERRDRYWMRHKKDRLTDITAPGSWSAFVLWGEHTSINKNLKDMLKFFNVK